MTLVVDPLHHINPFLGPNAGRWSGLAIIHHAGQVRVGGLHTPFKTLC